MTTSKAISPIALIAISYLIFFACLLLGQNRLSDPVASHFDGRGVPDGWSPREVYLLAMLGTAIFLPGIVVCSCFAFRFLPDSMINIPNKSYWLSSERRPQMNRYIFQQSLWFVCLAVFFVTCVYLSVIEANSNLPPQLSTFLLVIYTGGFLIGVFAWLIKLLWPFLKKLPSEASAEDVTPIGLHEWPGLCF